MTATTIARAWAVQRSDGMTLDVLTDILNQVKEANDAAWQEMQQASLQSLERLQKGWADALKHFT